MTTETRHPGSRGMPRTRRVALPHTWARVSIQLGDRAHPGGISRASGTTARRALDAPSRRRTRI